MKGVGAKLAYRSGSDVGINPAASEHQVRAVGPLSIRQHEVRSRFGNDYLFPVELYLDIHDEAYHGKRAPTGADALLEKTLVGTKDQRRNIRRFKF